GVHPVYVLHDRQASSSERIGEQECAGVGPVKGDARGWKLMMMIRRKCAPHDRAGCGEVNGKLGRDGGVLDVRDALRREQARKDMAVLAGFACGERSERPDRKAEVEANAVEVAGADAGKCQFC